ncbi:MAG: hypothetical protein ACC628_13835 [Pirellulaceae bacterium]
MRSPSLTGDLMHELVKWTEGDLADWKDRTVGLRFTLCNRQFCSYWLE